MRRQLEKQGNQAPNAWHHPQIAQFLARRELGVELQGGSLVLCPRAAQLFEGDLVTFP